MNKEIVLTPEQLFFMGRLLQAKYIDYAYVAAMSDIKQNYSLFEQEAKASLVASGVLTEDFSGNLEIEASALSVLKPVFFGETETALSVFSLAETNNISVYMFHFFDGNITTVTSQNGKLYLRTIDQCGIQDMVEALLPKTYNAASGEIASLSENKVSRFITAKNTAVSQSSIVNTYVEMDGVIYKDRENHLESLSAETFIEDIFEIIKGC